MLIALAIGATEILQLATGSHRRLNIATANIRVYRVLDDQPEAPPGIPWECPGQYWFNTQVYADKNGSRYYFWLKMGYRSLAGTQVLGLGTYTFGDVKNTQGTATLLQAFMFTGCVKLFDETGAGTLYVTQLGNGALDVRVEPSGPKSLDLVNVVNHGPTYDTYCLFRNYYTASWVYMYSEIIPGSCWSVQVT